MSAGNLFDRLFRLPQKYIKESIIYKLYFVILILRRSFDLFRLFTKTS